MRKRKDEFEEVSYENREETKHELVQVTAPFWLNATFMDKYGCGTGTQLVRYLHYTKDEIRKHLQEKLEYKIIKFEKATIPFPNICAKCHEKGIPRIERKSNAIDYHARESHDSDTGHHITPTNRPDEYWLVYDHQPKKCRIARFDINHFLFITPKNKMIQLHKHFFPFYLEKMKKESDISYFFQRLTSVSHA